MFYAKQFKYLLDKVKELDPDAEVVPSLLRIDFNLPIVGKCRLEYVHRGFDDEYDALGTMKLYYGDDMTEFDSLRYTIDGLEGLDRAIKRNMEQSPVNESVEETEDFATMSADELSGDVVSYLYDKYKEAAFIGEKSLSDGSIVLRFEWNGVDKDAVAKDLKDRYGDRIGFGNGHLQYAPEIKFDAIKVLPANDAVAVTESVDEVANGYELVENFPEWAISPIINNTWGDYIIYYGEASAREDMENVDKYMTRNGFCDITIPSDDEYTNGYNGFCAHPAFGKPCATRPVYAQKGEWGSLIQEYFPADTVEPAMTDIGGDFEAVEFYKDVKAVCDIAGKPALAEAVIKLHKAYNPAMEAVEKAHKVPRDIAVAFNDYIADTLYTRPETHDMLKEREFEPNWEWLDDNAEAVIKVWNETHDPSEIKRLLDNLDEDAACWFEGI